ncbi:MAG: insulinase family protein, partial [Sulfurovum sp.]|nr:insulinase family protein [Sulfurovum sp.]
MAAFVKEIEIKESKVPVVFEEEKYLPIVSIQLIFRNAGHLSISKDGLADMSARLMNEGTSKLGSV